MDAGPHRPTVTRFGPTKGHPWALQHMLLHQRGLFMEAEPEGCLASAPARAGRARHAVVARAGRLPARGQAGVPGGPPA
jgi:hypothetical protein